MDSLYPNLYERFKSEGLCPICLLEMELAPRYTCTNGHTICYRCKPYYHGCPTCLAPLDVQMPPSHSSSSYTPPPSHFLPHPVPPRFHENYPTAPPAEDFLEHERSWFPSEPPENQELRSCAYADSGCGVKVPAQLADLHESRCQFRPHLEEEQLPTDLVHQQDDLVVCRYEAVGCKVRTTPWRTSIHEKYCIYKDRHEALNEINEALQNTSITENQYSDPDELVECKYRKYGCMVNMPRRRKPMHQEKCNYKKYANDESSENEYDGSDESSSENEYDLNEQVSCRWAEYGCRVKPKRCDLETHEEMCNHKMEECSFKYNGCSALFTPFKRFAHESACQFAG